MLINYLYLIKSLRLVAMYFTVRIAAGGMKNNHATYLPSKADKQISNGYINNGK